MKILEIVALLVTISFLVTRLQGVIYLKREKRRPGGENDSLFSETSKDTLSGMKETPTQRRFIPTNPENSEDTNQELYHLKRVQKRFKPLSHDEANSGSGSMAEWKLSRSGRSILEKYFDDIEKHQDNITVSSRSKRNETSSSAGSVYGSAHSGDLDTSFADLLGEGEDGDVITRNSTYRKTQKNETLGVTSEKTMGYSSSSNKTYNISNALHSNSLYTFSGESSGILSDNFSLNGHSGIKASTVNNVGSTTQNLDRNETNYGSNTSVETNSLKSKRSDTDNMDKLAIRLAIMGGDDIVASKLNIKENKGELTIRKRSAEDLGDEQFDLIDNNINLKPSSNVLSEKQIIALKRSLPEDEKVVRILDDDKSKSIFNENERSLFNSIKEDGVYYDTASKRFLISTKTLNDVKDGSHIKDETLPQKTKDDKRDTKSNLNNMNLFGKRDVIPDNDPNADKIMANEGSNSYQTEVITKRSDTHTYHTTKPTDKHDYLNLKPTDTHRYLRRVTHTYQSNERSDMHDHLNVKPTDTHRYLRTVTDHVDDVSVNFQEGKNLHKENRVFLSQLTGTYFRPTRVSGIWSGLGSKPIFVENTDQKSENEGSDGSGVESGSGAEEMHSTESKNKNEQQRPSFSNRKSFSKAQRKTHTKHRKSHHRHTRKHFKQKDQLNGERKHSETDIDSDEPVVNRKKRMDKEINHKYINLQGNRNIILAFDEVHEIVPKRIHKDLHSVKPTQLRHALTKTSRSHKRKKSTHKISRKISEPSRDDYGSAAGKDVEDEEEDSGYWQETIKEERSVPEEPSVKELATSYQTNKMEEAGETRSINFVKRSPDENGYIGCFADLLHPERDLAVRAGVPFVTPNNCRSACRRTGYYYAGLQYGYLCFCGNTYGKYDMAPDSECNHICSGNYSQRCGGLWRNAIYSTVGAPDEPSEGPIPIYLPPHEVAPDTNKSQEELIGRSNIPTPQQANTSITSQSNVATPVAKLVAQQFIGSPAFNQTSSINPANSDQRQIVASNNLQDLQGSLNGIFTNTTIKKAKKRVVLMHFAYLHPLHFHRKVATTQTPPPTPPLRVEPGTRVFKGEIKLRQNWFDEMRNVQSVKYQILAGNVEHALKNIYKDDTNFLKAEVLAFKEGIINSNPDTLRKVVAEFALTFNENAVSPDAKLFAFVKANNKLDEMPVYPNSLKVGEYRFDPNNPKETFVVPMKLPMTNLTVTDNNPVMFHDPMLSLLPPTPTQKTQMQSVKIRAPAVVGAPQQNFASNLLKNNHMPDVGPSTNMQELKNYFNNERARTLGVPNKSKFSQIPYAGRMTGPVIPGIVKGQPPNVNPELAKRNYIQQRDERRRKVPYILRLFFWKDMLARKKRGDTGNDKRISPLARGKRHDIDDEDNILNDDDFYERQRIPLTKGKRDQNDEFVLNNNIFGKKRDTDAERRITPLTREKRNFIEDNILNNDIIDKRTSSKKKVKRKTKDLNAEKELKRSKRLDPEDF